MNWLVTGGAGYIGSHVVRVFAECGIGVVVIDDLSGGHRKFLDNAVPFVEGSILDSELLRRTFAEHAIDGVIHLAGFKYSATSTQQPLHTYVQNVCATITLLREMEQAKIGRIVYSSSAAVYGIPTVDLVTEDTPTHPESPYGRSKLISEWLLRDQELAAGLNHTSLRYFNVIGSGYLDLYDTSSHSLLPLVFDSLLSGCTPRVLGHDYPTPDGTCVRDFVHVRDLAVSHAAAAERLMSGHPLAAAYNLGGGTGVSVAQVMAAVSQVTGITFSPTSDARRPGDPAWIVADSALASRDLNWKTRHSLADMIASAWQARQEAARCV